ncbi:MAG: DUF2399 domain-containing protein [Chloroflexi bacterium]|nr:DUF2399 domain-containing protein [Chloroflexota bacterium]
MPDEIPGNFSAQSITPIALLILHTLLDRYEQPERQKVVRVRLNATQYGAYFSGQDVAPRRETNRVLQHLAEQGLVRVHWQKWEEGNWLEKVDLVDAQVEGVYRLLQRTPQPLRAGVLRRLLQSQTPQAPWHGAFLSWALNQLNTYRSPAPLILEDTAGEQAGIWNRDLLSALDALAQLSGPTLERTLSVRLFGDSKRLEVCRRALLGILRRHAPDGAEYGDDDWALLRAYHLDRVPEYIPLAGPLVLQFRSEAQQTPVSGYARHILDLSPFSPSLALSGAMLREIAVVACSAIAVITVENSTSFSELLAVRPLSLLALYTAGFASPAVVSLLQEVRRLQPALPFYHWGDVDVGGLRILAHLRHHLGPFSVRPLAMDSATLMAQAAHTQPLSDAERVALAQLENHPALADCAGIIKHLLLTGRKLEQEAVAAEWAIGQMTPG